MTIVIYAFAAFGALCALSFTVGGILAVIGHVRDARTRSRALDKEHEEMYRGDSR